MYLIVIIAIAVSVLVYFSFKETGSIPEPEIKDEAADYVSVSAAVLDKHTRENVLDRRRAMTHITTRIFLTYHIVFDCGDGEPLELAVPKEIYDEIEIGEQDTLVYSGRQFFGFGEHGAISVADVEAADGDGFTYDDFDESIDVELDISNAAGEIPQLTGEDREYFDKFRNRERLPSQTETVTDETPSIERYTPQRLLENAGIYPFLKWEHGVKHMVAATYSAALHDLNCYDGDSRTGVSADSVVINKNEVRVAITISERPAQFDSSITAEFGVNE